MGHPDAVAGLPRHRARDRLLVDGCCTLKLEPRARSERLSSDSVFHDVSGPGYVLRVIFGVYDRAPPQSGYRRTGKRRVDGVDLTSFQWTDHRREPPEGQLLWLAQVGGGKINGVNHTPWGLRIMDDCDTLADCRASAALVDTIRL